MGEHLPSMHKARALPKTDMANVPVVPALQRWRQKEQKFKVTLNYIASSIKARLGYRKHCFLSFLFFFSFFFLMTASVFFQLPLKV